MQRKEDLQTPNYKNSNYDKAWYIHGSANKSNVKTLTQENSIQRRRFDK